MILHQAVRYYTACETAQLALWQPKLQHTHQTILSGLQMAADDPAADCPASGLYFTACKVISDSTACSATV